MQLRFENLFVASHAQLPSCCLLLPAGRERATARLLMSPALSDNSPVVRSLNRASELGLRNLPFETCRYQSQPTSPTRETWSLLNNDHCHV